MNFATDTDLLRYEPTLFNDLPWSSQQRIHVHDGHVTGTSLSSATANFNAACVEAGDVVLAGGIPHEVLGRPDDHTLTISRVRVRPLDYAIVPEPGDQLEVIIRTFSHQTAIVHGYLLQMLDIDVDDPSCGLDEDSIVSLSVMVRLEVLGSLQRIYNSSLSLSGDNQMLMHKAGEYTRRFKSACNRAAVLIDTDGDGYGDERRTISFTRLSRV